MIRLARVEDFDAIWPFFARVVRAGETYAFDPSMQADEARAYWMAPTVRTYVAERDGVLEGTYLLRPNQPGMGNHVANAAFMVDPDRAGRGIGRALVEHCLVEARALGYLAMQFNFVVATNLRAIALWESVGFCIVGTLPRAFRHRELGFVDAHVMYRALEESGDSP
ncbi:GNAT family N-acetyltransferase [Nannocystis pusilla]|uniref:GNAT family N-acetyltransferase n=1 Tax=Nannocystis pusilla TaxID=889268 RepID=UPI003BEFA3AF